MQNSKSPSSIHSSRAAAGSQRASQLAAGPDIRLPFLLPPHTVQSRDQLSRQVQKPKFILDHSHKFSIDVSGLWRIYPAIMRELPLHAKTINQISYLPGWIKKRSRRSRFRTIFRVPARSRIFEKLAASAGKPVLVFFPVRIPAKNAGVPVKRQKW